MFEAFSLQNERAFDREIMVIGVGGLFSGLVASGLNLIAGAPVAELSVLAFAAIVGLLANLSDAKRGTPWLRLVLAVAAGAAMIGLLNVHLLLAGVVGGFLLGACLALEAGDSPMERVGIWSIYAAALAAAFFTTDALFTLGPLKSFDVPVAQDVIRGGVWSLFLALSTGFRHVQWSRDEVQVEFDDAIAMSKDEEAEEFLRSARDCYVRIGEELERDSHEDDVRERARSIATELALGALGLTRRAEELGRNARRQENDTLLKRVDDLNGRIEKARDPALRKELLAAMEEIVEQMRARDRMKIAVVRIEARQQRYLTGLERLHVTLVHNDSMSGKDGALNTSLENLSRLTDEVRWKDLSVEELCGVDFEELEQDLDGDGEQDLDILLAEARRLSGASSEVEESVEETRTGRRRGYRRRSEREDEGAKIEEDDDQDEKILVNEDESADEEVSMGVPGGVDGFVEEEQQEEVEQAAVVTPS